MGAECVRASPRPTRPFSHQLTESRFSPQKSRSNAPFEFQFKVQNLCLTSNRDNVYDVVFEIQDKMSVHFPHQDMSVEGKLFIWKNPHRQKITLTFDQICNHPLTIKVFSKHKEKLQRMSLKLDQVFRGAIHHDHMLPNMKSRLIFDLEVSQYVEMRISCSKFRLNNLKDEGALKKKFCYSLFLLLNNFKNHTQQRVLYELDEVASVGAVVLNHDLQQSSLRILIFEKQEMLESKNLTVFSELYIPYQKIISHCSHFKKESKGNVEMEKRTVLLEEDIDLLGQKKGKANFEIILETEEVYVEQQEGLISSQKGISSISPQFLKGLGGKNSSIFKSSNINLDFKQLKELVQKFKISRTSNSKPFGGSQSRKLLLETYKVLTTQISMSLDSEQFDEEPEYEETQEILLDILIEVGKLIVEGEDVINENVWKVFQTIFSRPQLSIRYIHAIENTNLQKKIGVKFYSFLCSTLEKIVRSTAMWITYHELKYTQKFVAFAYIRFPWLQKEFVKAIKKSSDPTINLEKLTDIGVFQFSKSPSKNLVFDWDYALFSHIKREPAYLEAVEQLQQTVESLPKWSEFLFNREDDQFYYGSLLELLNEAELSLSSQGKIMWEYFPYYGEVIGSFLGQMNKGQCIEYSPLFKEVSVKVMLNEKLLNIFLLYLFPKTCLFERSCVMKCLDLIKSCLDVIVSKRNRLPTDFNANYFYSGIVSILEFNHSYLSIRALWILYIYYDIFSTEFQENLDSYLLGKIFYALFLHWCGHVRRIFMCLLESKIAKKFNSLQKSSKQTQKQQFSCEDTTEKWIKYKKYINRLMDKDKEIQKEAEGRKFKDYHLSMKAKLQEKKKKKFIQNDEIEKTITSERVQKKPNKKGFLEIDPRDNSSYLLSTGKTVSDSRNRKWSVACESYSDLEIPQIYVKYLPKAVEQYTEVKKSNDVDAIVAKIMEMFQKKKTDF